MIRYHENVGAALPTPRLKADFDERLRATVSLKLTGDSHAICELDASFLVNLYGTASVYVTNDVSDRDAILIRIAKRLTGGSVANQTERASAFTATVGRYVTALDHGVIDLPADQLAAIADAATTVIDKARSENAVGEGYAGMGRSLAQKLRDHAGPVLTEDSHAFRGAVKF